MNPLNLIPLQYRLAAALLLIVAVSGAVAGAAAWVVHHERDIGRAEARQAYEAAIAKQKVDAAAKLAEEQRKVLDTERALNAAQRRIEEMADERKEIAAQYEKHLSAVAAINGGRLRDPHAAGCGRGGGGAQGAASTGAAGGAAGAAQAGGLLSVPLTDLLQRIVREAGEQADAYAACRDDALSIRRQLSPSSH